MIMKNSMHKVVGAVCALLLASMAAVAAVPYTGSFLASPAVTTTTSESFKYAIWLVRVTNTEEPQSGHASAMSSAFPCGSPSATS